MFLSPPLCSFETAQWGQTASVQNIIHIQQITNKPVSLPRKEQKKAAAEAAKVLSGLNMQPWKLLIDIFIDFNDCKHFEQLTQQVKSDIKIEQGVKIGDVPEQMWSPQY